MKGLRNYVMAAGITALSGLSLGNVAYGQGNPHNTVINKINKYELAKKITRNKGKRTLIFDDSNNPLSSGIYVGFIYDEVPHIFISTLDNFLIEVGDKSLKKKFSEKGINGFNNKKEDVCKVYENDVFVKKMKFKKAKKEYEENIDLFLDKFN